MLQLRELEKVLAFVWLAETWTKSWPTVSKLEMPDMPWFNVEEGKSGDKEVHGRCRQTSLNGLKNMKTFICALWECSPKGDLRRGF